MERPKKLGAHWNQAVLGATIVALTASPVTAVAQEAAPTNTNTATSAATTTAATAEQPATTAPADQPAPAAAEEKVEEIFVTGSRIKRTDLATPAPVTVLSRKELDSTGLMSIGDILQKLPAQSNAINVQYNNGGDGSTRVNLRGIGQARTLVLVNGRRFVPGGTGADSSVDLNSIPAEIIERIEVLKDGASAVYGSDAVGGVVNIITKRDFAGVDLNAYTGGTTNGGFVYTLGVTGGERAEKGGFLLSFQFFDQSDILAGQRDYSKQDLAYDYESGERSTLGSSSIPEGYFRDRGEGPGNSVWQRLRTPDSGPTFINDATDGFRNFQPTGNKDVGEGDFYNYQPENYLVTPSQRISLWGQGDYELSKRARAYFETSFTTRRSQQLLAPEPLFTLTEGIAVTADNVYNPFGRDFIDVRRRLVEVANRTYTQEVNTFRAVVGLDGSFADEGFFSTWSWDANFVYGRTTGLETKTGNLIRSRLAAAMGPSFIDADGVAYCGTPDAPIADCTPINLFGGAGSITQDMVKGLTYTGTARGYTDQRVANIQASGELFELWKRPVGLAVGYAFRREEGGLQPDPLTARGDTTGNKSEPVFGGFSEHAGFAEVNLPLLADLPGVQLFEVDAALRVFNFDTFGTDSMYKFGGRWQIVDHVALRATYSRAFRAPSVAELYSGQADSFQDIVDPCSTFDGAVRTPEAQANCSADGVPDSLEDDRTQLQARVGGNPNLTPETANILTAGIVVTPKVNKMLDGLSLTLDYFAIAVDNSVTAKGGDVILANCYTKATRSDCDLITRDPGGFVSTIIDTNTNAGGLDTAGIDFGLIYDMPSDAGSFRFTFDGVILSKIDQELANGRIIKGKDNYDLGGIYPTLRWNASVGWAYKGISAGLAGKFTGASKECGDLNDCSQEARDAAEAAGEPFFERTISSNFTADLYAGYSFSTAAGLTSIQAGINNLFDSPPPVIFNAFYYSDASAYDFIGRYFYIGLRQSL